MTTAQAGIPTTPTTEELVDRARAALQRCGVDPHMAYLTWAQRTGTRAGRVDQAPR